MSLLRLTLGPNKNKIHFLGAILEYEELIESLQQFSRYYFLKLQKVVSLHFLTMHVYLFYLILNVYFSKMKT